MTSLLLWLSIAVQNGTIDQVVAHTEQVIIREREYADLERIPTQGVSSSYPNWYAPDLLLRYQTIDYWLTILPDEVDKYKSRYVVAPLQGAIVPIITADEDEKTTLAFGADLDIMKYLEEGALHHPDTLGPWEEFGNYVIAGHTSYPSYRPGRHKTTMQFLPLMQAGDPLWLFDRDENGLWSRYNFIVTESYETTPDDIEILNQPLLGNELTMYGCYPFGTLEKRWVVETALVE